MRPLSRLLVTVLALALSAAACARKDTEERGHSDPRQPIDDRIRLIEAIWEGIEEESPAFEPTDAQKRELERRLADVEANPDEEYERDEVMAWLRSQP